MVLEAVLAVISTKGPSEFTLADVGQVAGLAPATLLQRFGSKQAMVVAALAHANSQHLAALEKLPQESGAEAVIRIFVDRAPGPEHEDMLADQLLWLREGFRNDQINKLSRQSLAVFRQAIEQRMPPLPLPTSMAVRLLEAQWHGALIQWGISREGHLRDYVAESLRSWFELIGRPPPEQPARAPDRGRTVRPKR